MRRDSAGQIHAKVKCCSPVHSAHSDCGMAGIPVKSMCRDWRLFPIFFAKHDGVLLDARLSGWNDAYIGRDPKTIRFACGDIVEAYFPYQNQVILGYVMELPPTKDELRSWVERDKKFASDDMPVTRDASDDTYMFMQDDKGGHEHQDALYVFKPHFPIPKPTLERLKKQYRRYLERYANKYFHKPLTNDERSWLKAHNVDIEP